ncbi:MAG: acetylglutamate kinase [Candidatus Omnitrophica bacterium]|nr:acetylglutamate kinase [Candidatus Omnitrophota bacterium]MBU4589859.1 acetylglutamate kinase [Candidatus Omnitrophota bacterium]
MTEIGRIMEEAIRKSAVLIEALPYIKAYANKTFVIKYGGSALIDPEIKKGVLQDIVFMSYVGIRPILVHGGGPFINQELKKRGIGVEFHEGLRVTPKETMEIVNSVLSDVNRSIAADIKAIGGRAISLNADIKDIIKTRPHANSEKLGFVGEIDKIEVETIKKSSRPRSVPVVSSIGLGADGEYYNVNADEASSEVSVAVKAVKLVLLTDVKGIMKNKDDESTLIPTITMNETEKLIGEGVIQGGMIPKVKACTKALAGGVSKTHIVDGRIPHSLLLEIFTDKGIGTEIVKQ